MDRKLVDHLTIYNSGRSRSRITLVTAAGAVPAYPAQLGNTRWILFGPDAARRWRDLLGRGWRPLDEQLPGGLSPGTWQRMKDSWSLHPPETRQHGDLQFLNFGSANSRVLLLRADPGTFAPKRLTPTAIISLDPLADHLFAELLRELPSDIRDRSEAAGRIVPGGLAGKTLLEAEKALSESAR